MIQATAGLESNNGGGTPEGACRGLHGAADAVVMVAAMGCMLPRPIDIVISERVSSISHVGANLLNEFHGGGQNFASNGDPCGPNWCKDE